MTRRPTGSGSGSFPADLLAFCADSAAACLARGPAAPAPCAPGAAACLAALLWLLSGLVLLGHRCRCPERDPGLLGLCLYQFLGHLCATVGAVLSEQLFIQVLMGGLAAVLDAVHFLSCFFPAVLCWSSKTERRLRMMRRRRRQHFFAVCVLMVVAGGFLKSTFTPNPANGPLRGRGLLQVDLQDNTEILGYILGLLSFVIACSSRVPAACRAYGGQMLARAHVVSGLLCSLAGALYAAAILLYDTQLEFLLRAMPWLLSAMCCATLDLLILVLHWSRRGTRRHMRTFAPDTVKLLRRSGFLTEEEAVLKQHMKQKAHRSAETKKTSEIGPYMDVSIPPARKICLREVTLSKEETEERPLAQTVRVIRDDTFCFSDSSCDSSLVSSDLEWDFEQANAQWRETTAKQQQRGQFPLQEWPTNPSPF